jgi:hypothetical protein
LRGKTGDPSCLKNVFSLSHSYLEYWLSIELQVKNSLEAGDTVQGKKCCPSKKVFLQNLEVISLLPTSFLLRKKI